MSRLVSAQPEGKDYTPKVGAVVVAAGQGLRAGQPQPKQFATWRGKPVVRHSVEALANAGVSPIVVVIPQGAGAIARDALRAALQSVSCALHSDLWPLYFLDRYVLFNKGESIIMLICFKIQL